MKTCLKLLGCAIALSCISAGTYAAEITVWTARALATVLDEVGPEFERTTGHKLNVTTDLSSGFDRRLAAGESADLLISGSASMNAWVEAGKLVRTTHTNIARSGIGVAVRAGTRKPDIRTVDGFKQALLDAKSIAYLKVGSGVYLDGLLQRLGIADAIKPKLTRPDSDVVSEMVAKGEVELGMVVLTQILTTPGVELVGPLPPEIQSYVMFSAALSANAKQPQAAKQLLEFLAGPNATRTMKAQGMEPATTSRRGDPRE